MPVRGVVLLSFLANMRQRRFRTGESKNYGQELGGGDSYGCSISLLGHIDQRGRPWSTPWSTHVKVSFDVAFHQSSGEGAWGFVARSVSGQFVAAAAGKLHNSIKDALQRRRKHALLPQNELRLLSCAVCIWSQIAKTLSLRSRRNAMI